MTDTRICFVLIRGLLREARHWGDFPVILQKMYPDALVLTPNIPGNGDLNHLTSPHTITGMTDAVRRQIPDHYSLRLIALSMGGMIAIDWMSRYPHEVSSVVLINTSLHNISPFYQRLRWQNYNKFIKVFFSSENERERIILALTSNNYSHDNDLLKSWQQWQQEYPVSTTSATNQLLASATFSISSIPDHPVLIISSSADRLVDYRCSKKIQQSWNKHYLQHNKAGHDLPLDDPAWLLSSLCQWYKQS